MTYQERHYQDTIIASPNNNISKASVIPNSNKGNLKRNK